MLLFLFRFQPEIQEQKNPALSLGQGNSSVQEGIFELKIIDQESINQ